jgi:hypothetical protein
MSAILYAFVATFVPLLGPLAMDCKHAEGDDKFVPTPAGCMPFMGEGKTKMLAADSFGAVCYVFGGPLIYTYLFNCLYAMITVLEGFEVFFMAGLVVSMIMSAYLFILIIHKVMEIKFKDKADKYKLVAAPAFSLVFDFVAKEKSEYLGTIQNLGFLEKQLHRAKASCTYMAMTFQGIFGLYWLRPKFCGTYLKTLVTLIIVDGLMPLNITLYALGRWTLSLFTWRLFSVYGMTQEFLQCARIRRRLMNFAYPAWNHTPPAGKQALKSASEVAQLAKDQILSEIKNALLEAFVDATESVFGSILELILALFVPGKALQYTFKQCGAMAKFSLPSRPVSARCPQASEVLALFFVPGFCFNLKADLT